MANPPYSEHAERAVLGSLLRPNDHARVFGMCADAQLDESAFFVPAHSLIWRAVAWLHANKKPVDVLTLENALRQYGKLDDVGGIEAIEKLIDDTPTAANAEHYIDQVSERWTARRVLEHNLEIDAQIAAGKDAREVLADHVHSLGKLADTKTDSRMSKDGIWARCLAMVAGAKKGVPAGLPTPWETFNHVGGGMVWDGVTLVVGGGGTRKSMLVNQIATHAGVECGIPGIYYSMEDSPERALNRAACMLAGVSCWRWESGRAGDEEDAAVREAFKRINSSPLHIFGARSMSLTQRRLDIARRVANDGVRFVIFDAFKEMDKSGGDPREEAKLMIWMADLAEEFHLAVPCVHHVNKGFNPRHGHRTSEEKRLSERITKRDVKGASNIWDGSRKVVALQCQWKRRVDGSIFPTNYVLDVIKTNYGRTCALSLDCDENTGVFKESVRPPFSDWTSDEDCERIETRTTEGAW